MTVMQEIINFRESRGINQLTFAKKIGITATCARQHEMGIAKNHRKYIEKVNAAFGTSFPDMSVCKVCGCEFEGRTKKCPECTKESKKPIKKEVVSLYQAAKEAQETNLSYGEFSSGITKIKPERNIDAPAFLNLGKTITI